MSPRGALQLDLDVNPSRKIQLHQVVNRLGIRIHHVDQTLVGADLELVARVLVDKGLAHDGELLDARRQRNWSDDASAAALCRLDDLLRRLIQKAVVIRLEANANFLPCHSFLVP